MLEVKPIKLIITPSQKRYNINLLNSSPSTLAYKISVTNRKALHVEPSHGFLPSQGRAALLLTPKSSQSLKEKIQINYAPTQEGSSSFTQAWAAIKKHDVEVKQFIVRVQTKEETISKEQPEQVEQTGKNKRERGGRLKRLPTIDEDSQFKQMLNLNRNNLPSPDLDRLMSYFKEQREQHFNEEQKEALCYELEQLGHRYIQEVNQSSRLRQQLSIAEGKLKESHSREMREQAVQSMRNYCEGHHVAFSSMVLLALLSFIFGFILSRFS